MTKGTSNKRRIVYVMGPAHSGSTVLTFLLAQHPEIATIGELKATSMGDIRDYRCSCGAPLIECDFWSSVSREASSLPGGFSLDDFGTNYAAFGFPIDRLLYASLRGPLFERLRTALISLYPGARRCLERVTERNRDLVEIITRLQGREVFLDGSKDPVRLRHLSAIDSWDIRVVLIVRDGRGTAYSHMKRHGLTMRQAASEWRQTCLEFGHVARYVSQDRIMTVRYEDLCADPRGALAGLYASLGIDVIEIEGIDTSSYHLLGHEMRLRRTDRIVCDDRWRKELSQRQVDEFEAIAGDINRSFGY